MSVSGTLGEESLEETDRQEDFSISYTYHSSLYTRTQLYGEVGDK